MDKYTVTIFKGENVPSTITYFNNYLDAYAFSYKYINLYYNNISLTPYDDAFKQLCSNISVITSILTPNNTVAFQVSITRGHIIFTNNKYIWDVINPNDALVITPYGYINEKVLISTNNEKSLLLPKYFGS